MTRLAQWRLSDGYSLRLGAFYAAVFLVVGVQLPFWPVWLAGRGLDPQEIATVFAATIWAKVVATPAIGALADRTGQRRFVMVFLGAIALIGYAMLWPITGFWPLLALNLVAAVAQSAVMPLGDAVTLAGVRDCGLDYGRVRVWGSLTFIIAALGSGAALADVAPATLGGNAVLLLVLATSAVLLAACLGIPQTDRPRAPIGTRRVALARLVGDRRFWLLVVSAAALQASHQLYYGFGTLYWRELGFFRRGDRRAVGRGCGCRNCAVLVRRAAGRAIRTARPDGARRNRWDRALEPHGCRVKSHRRCGTAASARRHVRSEPPRGNARNGAQRSRRPRGERAILVCRNVRRDWQRARNARSRRPLRRLQRAGLPVYGAAVSCRPRRSVVSAREPLNNFAAQRKPDPLAVQACWNRNRLSRMYSSTSSNASQNWAMTLKSAV